MKTKPWSGLHYVDLFAGPGIERIRETGALEWGSPLIAAQTTNPFSQLHLCELNKSKFGALETRVRRFVQPNPPQLIQGDANSNVEAVADSLPDGSLTLAFLDPTGLHLDFKTLVTLTSGRRKVDLLIFFPDHLDALRNWKAVYHARPNSNLSRVLGSNEWESRIETTPKSQWAQMFREVYITQIRGLGYNYFDYERIALPNGRHLYILLYCCENRLGAEFWRKVTSKKPGGQQTFEY